VSPGTNHLRRSRHGDPGGAATTVFKDRIGRLAPGAAADLSVIDFKDIAFPCLDPLTPPLDAKVPRAKPAHHRDVTIGGEYVYRQGAFTRIDRADVFAAVHRDLGRALSPDEEERRAMAVELLPHVRAFYDKYVRFDGTSLTAA